MSIQREKRVAKHSADRQTNRLMGRFKRGGRLYPKKKFASILLQTKKINFCKGKGGVYSQHQELGREKIRMNECQRLLCELCIETVRDMDMILDWMTFMDLWIW